MTLLLVACGNKTEDIDAVSGADVPIEIQEPSSEIEEVEVTEPINTEPEIEVEKGVIEEVAVSKIDEIKVDALTAYIAPKTVNSVEDLTKLLKNSVEGLVEVDSKEKDSANFNDSKNIMYIKDGKNAVADNDFKEVCVIRTEYFANVNYEFKKDKLVRISYNLFNEYVDKNTCYNTIQLWVSAFEKQYNKDLIFEDGTPFMEDLLKYFNTNYPMDAPAFEFTFADREIRILFSIFYDITAKGYKSNCIIEFLNDIA